MPWPWQNHGQAMTTLSKPEVKVGLRLDSLLQLFFQLALGPEPLLGRHIDVARCSIKRLASVSHSFLHSEWPRWCGHSVGGLSQPLAAGAHADSKND